MRSARSREIFLIFGNSALLVRVAQRRARGRTWLLIPARWWRLSGLTRRAGRVLRGVPRLREKLLHPTDGTKDPRRFGGQEDRRALALRDVRERLEIFQSEQVHRSLTVRQ